jgi:ApbE family
VAGSLHRLPTRPKQAGASKGRDNPASPRSRTRSSNPSPSTGESANFWFLSGGISRYHTPTPTRAGHPSRLDPCSTASRGPGLDRRLAVEASPEPMRRRGGRVRSGTVQPLWNVYAAHFFGSEPPSPQGPEPRAIGQALALVDWQGVDVTCRRIAMAQPGMGLTLNGIAQGYLTDRIVDILRANGCDRVLADMGRSEIQLVGHRPDGQAWRIGLADPLSPARIAVTLDLADRCISTSGGYGTKFEATGRHHHLFDTTTGTSAGHYIAVSVVAAWWPMRCRHRST